MKILVPVKNVVDANIKVKLDGNGSLDTAALKHSINPFDEIAVEEAVLLKTAGKADEIVAVTIGPKKAADALRRALAMGADRGVHLETDEELEPLSIAKILANVVATEEPGLVICGKQAIDNDAGQVGPMLAAICDMPEATNASKLSLEEGRARVTREIDGGLETVELVLPAVVTADLRLNSPRYVTLPMMMKAKKKPLETKSVSSLGLDLKPHTEIVALSAPKERTKGVILQSVDELLERLRADKLIK